MASDRSDGSVDLRVPKWLLPILLTIVIQGGGATIYVTRLGSDVSHLAQIVKDVRTELTAGTQFRYTSTDASRDKALMTELLVQINRRVDLAEKRIERLEDKNSK